jgi:sporulation protein YlmC with PRC-barrel domain
MANFKLNDALHFGMSESTQGRQNTLGGESEGARVIVSDDSVNRGGPGPYVMAADTLEGDDVLSPDGDKLAKLEKVMLDVESGRIAYAVLSSGGFLGIGDKLLAVPWRALTLDADRECFILDVSKEQLEQAPGFDKDHWPSMGDDNWAREVHTYYRALPYYWD